MGEKVNEATFTFHPNHVILTLTLSEVKERLRECKQVTKAIVQDLTNLRATVSSHHDKVLKIKTSGTTATTLGTALAVTGLVMAPVTFGASLVVSSIGAVSTIGGAAVNMITDIIDQRRKRGYLENIQALSASQQSCKEHLTQLLSSLEVYVEHFQSLGLSRIESFHALLITGDRPSTNIEKGIEVDEAFEFIDVPNWSPVKKFAFRASIQSFKLVKNSHTLNAITIAGRSGAVTASNVTVSVGRLVGTAVFKTTLAAVGVIFTTIDVALLVKEWKTKDPTTETIDAVIEELTQELEQFEELFRLVTQVSEAKMVFTRTIIGPVVGSSVFAVKSVARLINGATDLASEFYGLQTHIFKIGEYTIGSSEQVPSSPSEEQEHTQVELIQNIHDIFPIFETEKDLIPINVINPSILNLQAAIIDKFLASNNLPPFNEFKHKLPPSSSILQDYHSPMQSNVTLMIQNVLIAYIKLEEDCYVNSNKWECQVIIDKVTELGINYLEKEIEDMKSNLEMEQEVTDLREISDLIEILICHKSYLDPVAATVWTLNNEQNDKILSDVMDAINSFLRGLRHRIILWACELVDVI